jgi:hypothetical protein
MRVFLTQLNAVIGYFLLNHLKNYSICQLLAGSNDRVFPHYTAGQLRSAADHCVGFNRTPVAKLHVLSYVSLFTYYPSRCFFFQEAAMQVEIIRRSADVLPEAAVNADKAYLSGLR